MSETLNHFTIGMRVKIVDHASWPELNGMTGVVVRRLVSRSHCAWVTIDQPLPSGCSSFSAGDPSGHGQCVKLYLDECESAEAVGAKT